MFNCLARESETFYWYWRHGQSLEQMEASLGYMPLGCEGVDTSGCPFDLPTLRRVKCGPIWDDAHYDCTPQICNSAYCRQAGWTDGRSCCAVRQEGDPTREACELKAMGGKIQWRFSEQSGGIAAIPFNDNFGLRIVGTGSLLAECYVASQPGKQMCIDGRTGGPLRISR